jgi:DNA excision repair protein ERCC-3
MDIINSEKQWKEIQDEAVAALAKIDVLKTELKQAERSLSRTVSFLDKEVGDVMEREPFLDFFKTPYAIIPFGKNKVLVAVPKFVKNFQVGWLWKETESFYIYQFDQYSAWLSDAPSALMEAINFKHGLAIEIEGNVITFDDGGRKDVKEKLKNDLTEIGENSARIKRGHVFDVIATAVENGCLPFKPRPVAAEDIRPQRSKIKLRPYQKIAVDKFLETGATGVFHPTGAGKSFISLYLMDIIKGRKQIIVPTITLVEQWKYYIEANIPESKNEIRVVTYSGWRDIADEYALTIYDECQRLPADTFSRIAVIKTKYRLGLSASPHREDGRESYIFALTGFPVGLNWQEYMKTVGRSYHPINVHVVHSGASKIKKLRELVDFGKKTLIFCDTIEIGKAISRDLGIPYIYGQTTNRLHEIEENKVVCVSRVADLGVSIKDLQRVIEVDFLFGSRQQELQRTGRLMHAEHPERHDIIMTEGEMQKYGKRLWALQEKGFTVKVAA